MPGKKILFISHDAERTGAPAELLLIVRYLDRTRYEPTVLLGKEGPLQNEFANCAPVLLQSLFPRAPKYLREIASARRRIGLLRNVRPDLLYCNTVMTAKWLLYAQLLHIPATVHVHELSAIVRNLSPVDKFLLRNPAHRLIAASAAVENCLRTDLGLNTRNITVFHECIDVVKMQKQDVASLRKELFPGRCDLVIGCIGRIAPMKGTDLFLRVAARVKSALEGKMNVKFLIVGGAARQERNFYDELLNLRDSLSLKDDCVITGPRDDVRPYYSLADIILIPSREDPFPLVLLEAMAMGKPVVAFSTGGIGEAVTPDCGLLAPPLDVETMAQNTLTLVHDPDLRGRFGAAGRARAEGHFDIRHNIRKLETIIDGIL